MKKFQCYEDNRIVDLLTEFGIKYSIEDVTFNEIDIKDLGCQTRLNVHTVEPEQLRKIKDGMERGDRFPMTLLQRRKDKMLTPVTGNHRIRALGSTGYTGLFAAMVVGPEVDRSILKCIATRDNSGNGNQTTEAASLEQAVGILINKPIPDGLQEHKTTDVKKVASQLRVSGGVLSDHYRATLLRHKIKSEGKTPPAGRHVSLYSALWTKYCGSGSEEVVAEALRAVERGVSDEQIQAEVTKKASIVTLPSRLASLDGRQLISGTETSAPYDTFAKLHRTGELMEATYPDLPHRGMVEADKIASFGSLLANLMEKFRVWSEI